MIAKKYFIIVLSLLSLESVVHAQVLLNRNTPQEVLAAMTLEEKAALVVGAGRVPGGNVANQQQPKVPGAAGNTTAIPRLGIPSIVLSDGPAGVRISPIRNGDSTQTYYATGFPVSTLLASTWDPNLATLVGRAFGNEVKEYGIDILLAPAINIQRNPLNGRNFEYYSEDPLVSGKMAAAFIRGIETNNIGTSVKHFAANNQESNRTGINEIISERALREIYLRNFRIAISDGTPWTVMSSYNKINDTYTAERRDLLTTILRDEWKFTGFVMTDWRGGHDWTAEMNAGNDLIMPGRPSQVQSIISAVRHDSLKMRQLDTNVLHILKVIVKTPAFLKYQYSNKPDLQAHARVARQAATEGMILLKNNAGALPFGSPVKTIAAFGNGSYNTLAGGMGSGDVNKAYVISIFKGLSNAGYSPDASLETAYTDYFKQVRAQAPTGNNSRRREVVIPEMTVSNDIIAQKANSADLAVITIARNSGEGADRRLEDNYNLTEAEKAQIHQIAHDFHSHNKKVVAVLNIAGVIDMKGWQDDCDAILLAWMPGQEAGNAIADILSGKVNPSGKLATTFPMNYSDVPSAKNFPGTPAEKPTQVVYQEGIYVGYRYYDSFNVKPMYEFGYGLSYTNFSYSPIRLSAPKFDGMITASLSITNTGKVAGREVAQLYISAPDKTIDKPMQELRGFNKTRLLQPGESQQLTFSIREADLVSFYTEKSKWIAEPGEYKVKVGASSRDIRQTATFKLGSKLTTEDVIHKALQPPMKIDEFKPITTNN